MDRRRRDAPGPDSALADPAGRLRAKIRSRATIAQRSRLDLPDDRSLQDAVDWGKQNLADLTRTASDLRSASSTRAGPTRRRRDRRGATFIGAGYPDYPWLFATDGAYTAFAAVAWAS